MQAVKALRHLHKVDLSWNLLTSVFVSELTDMLPQFKFLTEFYVHGNKLTEVGIIDLCAQMLTNDSIVDLKIGWSNAKVHFMHSWFSCQFCRWTSCVPFFAMKIVDAGCIARMLRENTTLKYLNIDGIAIGDSGAENIADALCTNESLLELHMVCLRMALTSSQIFTLPRISRYWCMNVGSRPRRRIWRCTIQDCGVQTNRMACVDLLMCFPIFRWSVILV